MTMVVIRCGLLERKEFVLSNELDEIIRETSKDLNLPEKRVIEIALGNMRIPGEKGNSEKIVKLHQELFKLQKEMYAVDRKRGALYTKNRLLLHRLKELSLTLIGLVNHNRTLRRILKMEEKYGEIRKLAEYYLFMDHQNLKYDPESSKEQIKI